MNAIIIRMQTLEAWLDIIFHTPLLIIAKELRLKLVSTKKVLSECAFTKLYINL